MFVATRINIADIKNELLTKENYDPFFDCSFNDDMGLNEFYHTEALEFQRERLGITYQFSYYKKTIGFVTLAMYSIQREKIPDDDQLPIRIRHYPPLLLGRLASDNRFRGQGVGTFLLKWSIGAAVTFSRNIGCRYLILQTNEERTNWYQDSKRGMKPLEVIKRRNRPDDWWFFKRLDIDEL